MKNLTYKQRCVLECIKNFIEKRKYPPTVREICAEMGVRSTSTVHGYLSRLEKEGFIKRDPQKNRSIEIVNSEIESKGKFVKVPVLGKVAAGEPVFAEDNAEEYFPVMEEYLKGAEKEYFILKVKGESMKEKGIYDGDYILVRKQSGADNGDIVVALIDDSATVKTFYKEKDFIRLQPENSLMKPIIAKEVIILGKVVSLYRCFR